MTGLWVLLAVLSILAALLWLPVGVRVVYGDAGAVVRLMLGQLGIQIYPRKKRHKVKKKKKDRKQKANAKPKREMTDGEKHPQPAYTKQEILEFVKVISQFAGKLKKKLVIPKLTLHVTFGGEDAGEIALNYGRAWALLGLIIPVLENSFTIKNRDIQALCDYAEKTMKVQLEFWARIRIGQVWKLSLCAAVQIIQIYMKKKRRCNYESSSS